MSTLTTMSTPDPPVKGDVLYEIVNGEVRECPPMSAFETSLANILHVILDTFVVREGLGRAYMEMLFLIDPAKNLQRRPDIAFVSYKRWPRDRRVPRTAAWDVVPNVALEVVSRTNTWEEVVEKIRDYFRTGVEQVWVFSPSVEQVYVYTSVSANRILGRDETLDGGDVIPGFGSPLAQLFGGPDNDESDEGA